MYRGVSRGRAVAVKVVHPTTAGAVASDLAALRFLAALLERVAPATCASLDPAGLVRDFAEKMERSVDMRAEHAALARFRENFGGERGVRFPEPLAVGDGVVVVASPGRGEGLFAARPIARGTFVMDYLGEDLDEAGLAAKYGTEPRPDSSGTAYLLELNGVLGLEPTFHAAVPSLRADRAIPNGTFCSYRFVDAVDPARSNPARFINHAPRPNLRKVKQRFPDRRLRLYAARDVAAGEELFFDYGDSYWTGREGEVA